MKVIATGATMGYVAPKIALARATAGISPTPLGLPYHYDLVLEGIPGRLESECVNADYVDNAKGTLDIDESGNVEISSVDITGFDQGDGAGTITIEQSEIGIGTYKGVNLAATVPVLYADDNFPGGISAVMTMQGKLYEDGADVDVSIGVEDYCDETFSRRWGKKTPIWGK